MLRTDRLTIALGGKTLCRELSVAFEPGECWAVLGPNGNGKSTLLHALGGIRTGTSGLVLWQDQPIGAIHPRWRAQHIGILFQEEPAAFWGTVSEYVMLGTFPHGDGFSASREHAVCALRAMRLEDLAGRTLQTLSGGERQRARIAQLLAQRPEVYCLDEPLLHLDLRHQLESMELFRALAGDQRKTVLMVLHDSLWASRYCDHALLVYARGEILAGSSGTVLTRENLEALYGCSLEAFNFMNS